MTRAGIYCRISRDAEQEGLGVARQEEDCRRLAEREGYVVTDVYIDNDISASTKSRKPRPSYDRLIRDVRDGMIDVILAYSNSRLTRRPAEWLQLIELANRDRIRIRTVASGEHDLSTADGRATALTVAAWDAAEAERTAERVARAHLALALAGAHNGPRPYGWDFSDDRGLVVNPAEASVIKECVERVLAGEAIWRITRDLNERSIKTSTGHPWATQVLRRMLLRWRNCGVRTHHGREAGEGQWEAIIDRATHERVVALLTDPARRKNNRGTEPKYLLTSLALCGECGRNVVGTNTFDYVLKNGRTRHYPHYYKCPHAGCQRVQRRMADVDEQVTAVVLGYLESEGVRLLGGDPVAARHARERVAALSAKLAITADQFAADEITDEQLKRITAAVRPQLEAEQAKLRTAQPASDLAEFAGPNLREAWESADVPTRKRIIRQIGMKITIHRVGSGRGAVYDPNSVSIAWS